MAVYTEKKLQSLRELGCLEGVLEQAIEWEKRGIRPSDVVKNKKDWISVVSHMARWWSIDVTARKKSSDSIDSLFFKSLS